MISLLIAPLLLQGTPVLAAPQDSLPVQAVPAPTPAGDVSTMDPLWEDPLKGLLKPLNDGEAWTEENLHISWDIYFTLLYQSATRTIEDPSTGSPYSRDAGTGRLDLGFNWTAFETPGARGEFHFLARSGGIIGQDASYNVGDAIGSMPVGPDALYWGENTSLCLAYWQQSFMNDDLIFTAGKVQPNQYISLSQVANDETQQFISGTFDGLDSLGSGLGTYAPGVAVQASNEWVYFNAIVIDAQGGANTGFGTIDEGKWWAAAQLGYSPKANANELKTNLAVILAGTNYGLEANSADVAQGDNTGYGFGVMFEQEIAPSVGLLLEYGSSQAPLSTIEQIANIAVGVREPFGRRNDYFGVALSWSKPTSAYSPQRREEQMLETFYRIQLTESLQLTPDLQVLFQPATGDPDPVVIFGLRLRMQF